MTELSSTAQAAGFPSIRNAESQTLALPNTFQVPAATPPRTRGDTGCLMRRGAHCATI